MQNPCIHTQTVKVYFGKQTKQGCAVCEILMKVLSRKEEGKCWRLAETERDMMDGWEGKETLTERMRRWDVLEPDEVKV